MLRTLQTQDFSRDTMDEVFHRLDTDHDGFVDFDEVVALIFLVQQSRGDRQTLKDIRESIAKFKTEGQPICKEDFFCLAFMDCD
mmetsp:Transcript_41933/g.67437  ORF Transcript_41933/g.67437 Transcript_41933/m.67437 type:complete len:84 (+) Transcript_41933:1606-1857(+)